MGLVFTGERLIPDEVSSYSVADHMERYRFATGYAKQKTVLDIACGEGYGSQILSDAGATSVLGVDVDAEVVDHAAQKYGSDKVSFRLGDVQTFQTDQLFDLIISFETIEHVPDHRAMLLAVRRALVPGGILIVSSPNRPITSPWATSIVDPPANKFHVREFALTELIYELRTGGFVVSANQVFGQRLYPPAPAWLLRSADWRFLKLHERLSPLVRRFRWSRPRYIVVVAVKAEA